MTNPTLITSAAYTEPNALEDHNFAIQQNELKLEYECYDYGARFYDPSLGRFHTQDRFAEDFSEWSPYHYANNNPILNIDINGDSTFVTLNENGTYNVTGGNLDNEEDRGVYMMGEDGAYTQVGESLTTNSFFDDDGNAITGAVIDPNSSEGTEFILDLAMEDPCLPKYILNATNGGDYDFKDKDIKKRPKGTTLDQHRYRGSAARDGVFGSARDFGNIGAGIVAGRNGLSWEEARAGFDLYQSYKSTRENKRLTFTIEGPTTQKAQKVGYTIGIQLRKKVKKK